MLVQQTHASIKVFLSLVDVESQLVFQRHVTRLEQHGVGGLDGVAHLFRLLRNVAFFGQSREPFQLFFFEQTNAVKIVLNHILLLASLSYFIVVGGNAGYVVEHFSSLVRRHFGEARHVTLKDDVVTVRTGIGGAEQAMKHLLRTVFSIEFVGGHRVVRGRQSDASGHPNLFFVKGQSPSTVAHHGVGENKRDGTVSGRFRVFPTVENQIR